MSAVFETVDHTKLLEIFQYEIGLVISYRENTKVKIGDEYSELIELLYGVAPGSFLGPILFKIYIRSFYQHVEVTKFNVEGFVYDHQLINKFLLAF